jgi:hypothetical protein
VDIQAGTAMVNHLEASVHRSSSPDPRHEATSGSEQVALRAPRSPGATGMGAATRSGPGSFTGSVAPNTKAATASRLSRSPEHKPNPTPFSWVWVSLRVMRLVSSNPSRGIGNSSPSKNWVRFAPSDQV